MEAVEDAVTVNGTATVPFGRGVTGDVMDRLTPCGVEPNHDATNVTVPSNPFMERTVTVTDPLPPWIKVTPDVDVIEKSGAVVVRLELLVGVVLVVSVLEGELTVIVEEAESSLGLLIAATA